MLTRDPERITVGQVLRALEGPVRIVSCMMENDHCAQLSRCNLRLPVQKIQAGISHLLDTMTVSELIAGPVLPVDVFATL